MNDEIVKIAKQFKENDFELLVVGGAPRNLLLDIPISDYDLITDAKPEQIKKILSNYKILTHAENYGILIIVTDDIGPNFEIATYRVDGTYKNNRKPESVTFTTDLKEDLLRRDFLCNTICYDPLEDKIIDLLNGCASLHDQIIQSVGNPDERINEDALRILRAFRFAIELDFSIDPELKNTCFKNQELLNNISGERKRDELCKMIKNIETIDNVAHLFDAMSCLGLYVKYNHVHTLLDLKLLDKQNSELIFSILLQDKSVDEIDTILRDFRFPRKFIYNVSNIVKLSKTNINNCYDIKYLINELGDFLLARDVLMLQGNVDNIQDYKEICRSNHPIFKHQLNINGDDLLDLDIEPRDIGDLLDFLLKFVHVNPEFNNKNDLIDILKQEGIV